MPTTVRARVTTAEAAAAQDYLRPRCCDRGRRLTTSAESYARSQAASLVEPADDARDRRRNDRQSQGLLVECLTAYPWSTLETLRHGGQRRVG
jgi:hypothetical protein